MYLLPSFGYVKFFKHYVANGKQMVWFLVRRSFSQAYIIQNEFVDVLTKTSEILDVFSDVNHLVYSIFIYLKAIQFIVKCGFLGQRN